MNDDFEIIDNPQKREFIWEDEKSFHEENVSLIITNIYIGNRDSAYNTKELSDNNIQCVLCIETVIKSEELINWYEQNKIMHYQISILDNSDADISKYWEDIYNIISDHYCNHKNILIHCQMGVSRSATAIIYWLMRISFETGAYKQFNKNGRILDYLINFMRTKRPVIRPNYGFMRYLRQAESEFQKQYI